ncbi:MAG: SMC-Scp complex subunit ScpB [Candidatus Omnitrophota bacterium]
MTKDEIKRIIEALLFASDRPVTVNDITSIIEEVDSITIRDLAYELKADYEAQNRCFTVTEIAGGFQLVADPFYAPWIRKLLGKDKAQKLSMAALETLAIIAYKQPMTKAEVEAIRGVNVERIVDNLQEKLLIKTNGRKEGPGRPFLYATTDEFLVHFGLRGLGDLPLLREFTEKDIEVGEREMIIENLSPETGAIKPESAQQNVEDGQVSPDAREPRPEINEPAPAVNEVPVEPKEVVTNGSDTPAQKD